MPRDNFTLYTKETLGLSVGFNCVRPGCARPTTALNPDTNEIARFGYAAHDSAAAPGGPRYDATITPEQRKALENGAHLCPACARLVDIDPERFPLGTIQMWQKKAMDLRQKGMHSPNQHSAGFNMNEACEAGRKFLRVLQVITFDGWTNSMSKESLLAIDGLVRESHPMVAGNKYWTQFPRTVNLQMEILGSIKIVKKEIQESGNWFYSEDHECWVIKPTHSPYSSGFTPQKIESIQHSLTLVRERMNDSFHNREKLSWIVNSSYPGNNLYDW